MTFTVITPYVFENEITEVRKYAPWQLDWIFEQDNSTKKGSPYEARLIEYSIGNDISRQTPSGIQWENKPFDKRYDDTRALLSRFRNMAQPELPALDFLPNGLPLTNDFVGDLDTLAKTETGKYKPFLNMLRRLSR